MPNIASPTFKANPFEFYARLRATSPIQSVRIANGQDAWLLSRYDDALAMFKDDRLVKDKLNTRRSEDMTKDQLSMPSQQGLRSHDRCDLSQNFAT